jgi:hypothetical protein
LGIKIAHWINFFKAMSETSADEQIEQKIERLRGQIRADAALEQATPAHLALLEMIEQLELLRNLL